MSEKVAFITGITGQDGSYLAEFLLGKGYRVHGLKRRASSLNTARIDHLYQDPHDSDPRLVLHYGDMTDSTGLLQIIKQIRPDEIYHLAAQSHVAVSFEAPEYTADVDALGTLRLLEAVKQAELIGKVKFYNAATSELYGLVNESRQHETSRFYPRSPYAAAKLYAYWITVNYREAYGLFACNGIMFNHESPRRGETFVTRKITRALAAIAYGQQSCLYLGNLDARRDWGHARDYMEMAWTMLQQESADDFVIATGEQRSVRQFVLQCAKILGIELSFQGSGIDEIAKVISCDSAKTPSIKPGQVILKIDPRYFRPSEVDELCGDASKAREKLGFSKKTTFEELCQEMVDADILAAKRNKLLIENGYFV